MGGMQAAPTPMRSRPEHTPANDNYPPVLTRSQAAAMCQLTPAGFDAWVRKGIVPPPIAGTRRWSRDAILSAIAGSSIGIGVVLSPYEKLKAEHARKA